ncbi:MAG: TonB-dependent receptor [Bacteroidetes bacterium]|nr:TonB-dependent receptor [Bacteroidota bacterium]
MRKQGTIVLLFLLLCLVSNAQDTVSLKTVEITAQKNNLWRVGKKVESIDSTIKEQFKFNSVGDALSFNSPVFIKNYGAGAVASTAFRGGNASQTALLWNGFNLQNSMLGQADLSLLPAVLFENIDIEYGGSAALWGSGAVGGSIHLNNKTKFNQGIFTSSNLGAGSFGYSNASTNVLLSKQRFISSTKLYGLHNQNNFKYEDNETIKRRKNANYTFYGLMQEFKFLINDKQLLSVNAWINSNHRRLPASNPNLESKMFQKDEALRLTADWSYVKTTFKSNIRAAAFYDRINYTDSIAKIFSKNLVRTIIAENENYFQWHKNNQLNFGVNVTSSRAVTENYESPKTLSRASFLAGNKFVWKEKFTAYAALRAEYFSVGKLPITGNVSLEYKLFKTLSVMLNAAKVYRQPTLNELYWQPNGNKNLKPEQGYTGEANVEYKNQIKHFSVLVSGAAFTRSINDWILWLPGAGGNPTPVNVQQVWSRGAETTWKLNYKKNNFNFGISVITSYVLSTTQKSYLENSSAIGKQLIYTPRYTANGNFSAGYKHFNLVFFHQYIGYRFTASDNSWWLNPYQVSSLRTNYSFNFKRIKLITYLACNNLFNSNYRVIAGYPMPLRNFEFGITIQTLTQRHEGTEAQKNLTNKK